MHVEDTTNLIPRWVVTVVTVILAALAVIANVLTMTVSSGAWLGLSDIAWHWVLLVCAVLVALNAALNRAVLADRPTNTRLRIAHALHVEKHRLEHDPQIAHD
jgi:uncharacterized membrane protein (DUF106 family)